MNNRWMMYRIGLINFWYYDKEEFQFSNGRLLLRGANGSGKSVTMQSFIPLLLDGNKSPERLDPFGSRARKMENYLLGEEESQEERTGYLYMEFKREDTQSYLTIGMGLKARRGKPLDFWGFSIIDGRRIGIDFHLYKEMGEEIPLSKKELKNRIADGGQVKESQREYMQMVNELLFGFGSLEEYDELIKLLVQLRTPKLSKDFKPTVIYEIMNNALQPLSDEDLRPMSEAIENMDNIKSQLDTLKISKKAADKIKDAYDQYNRYILFEKAKDFYKADEELKQFSKEKNELEKERLKFQEQYHQSIKNIEDLEIQEKTYKEKEQQLKKHDSFNLKEEILQLEKGLLEDEKEKRGKDERISNKKEDERSLVSKIKEVEAEEALKIQEVQKILEDMEDTANSLYFSEQLFLKEELLKNMKSFYDFGYVSTQFKDYMKKISNNHRLLQQEEDFSKSYDQTLEQYEEAKREEKTMEAQLQKAQQLLLETKEEFVEKIYHWEKTNHELKLPREVLVKVTEKIHLYGEKATFDDITMPIRHQYSDNQNKFHQEKSKQITELTGLKKRKQEKEAELTEWKNKKDPEPQREEKVVKNRAGLEKLGIPFIPFFMAVDFQKDVPKETMGVVEEALIDMGILDALIIPSEYRDKIFQVDEDMADRYLFPNPQYLQHELSQYLKSEKPKESPISSEDIELALKSVLLDTQAGQSFISEDGEYGIGLIRGKVTKSYIPKFIGIQARRQFREEMIMMLEKEIEEFHEEIQAVNKTIDQYEERLQQLEKEFSGLPSKDDLETALNQVKEYTLENRQWKKEVERKEDQVKKAYEAWQLLRQQVWEATQGMEVPSSRRAYEEAVEAGRDYQEQLQGLKEQHLSLTELIKRKDLLKQQHEELLLDIDDLLYDFLKIERKIKENLEMLQHLKEQLKLTNYEEIEKEIEDCIERLRKIPKEKEEAIQEREAGRIQQQTKQQEIYYMEEKIKLQKKLQEIYKDSLYKELSLGYIYPKNDKIDIGLVNKRILQELKPFEKQGKTRDDYIANLQEKHHQNRQYLVEYHLITEYIFSDFSQEAEEVLMDAKIKQRRLKLKGKIQGKEVNFYQLLEFIDEAINENEKLFQESDRQLFEDILANTISKKIRAKIYNSQDWVNKMNQLMEAMNTSSGLSFSLSWRPKKRETEDQMDTKELVELLKMDTNLLKPGDFKKLSQHFQSKILEARKKSEELTGYQSFHNIMKEILDYRKWFEFQLFYKKTGEVKKELTNNAFDRFSGGEKAMAMYVPLFSSVYARYQGANRECPRLISLDEAFAGVDENNIRDMFKLLDELNLNFIMNSQILWGDYDTVKSLSICELIRPNNADFVTVIRYLWDGKVKELVIDGVGDDDKFHIA